MYFPKISNMGGMNEKRKMTKCKSESEYSYWEEYNQTMNITIGGIKDIDCNTKINLLIISVLPLIEFPISGLRVPQ